MVATQSVLPADLVEGPGLSGPVASGPVQVKGRLCVRQYLPTTALAFVDEGEGEMDLRLAGAVAELDQEIARVAEVRVGVIEPPQPAVDVREALVDAGLALPVGEPAGGGQGGTVRGHPVMPQSLPVE